MEAHTQAVLVHVRSEHRRKMRLRIRPLEAALVLPAQIAL